MPCLSNARRQTGRKHTLEAKREEERIFSTAATEAKGHSAGLEGNNSPYNGPTPGALAEFKNTSFTRNELGLTATGTYANVFSLLSELVPFGGLVLCL